MTNRTRPYLALSKGQTAMLRALFTFDSLTAEQATRLCFSAGSFTYGSTQLKGLVDADLAITIGGKGTSLPRIYTLTGSGRTLASSLFGQQPRRFRPKEAREKQTNTYFLRHTLAVNDVLISASLLAKRHPAITLTQMYREPELRRKIYVDVPPRICIEPDAGCQFLTLQRGQEQPETWEEFFFIELYRTLPASKSQFKQKIAGYVTYVASGQHEAFFNTSALSLAIIAQTEQMLLLKSWTAEALTERESITAGDWFFFCSLDPATTSPENLFLAPIWEHAFGTTKTPLLVLE